jgi:hypothetical protein
MGADHCYHLNICGEPVCQPAKLVRLPRISKILSCFSEYRSILKTQKAAFFPNEIHLDIFERSSGVLCDAEHNLLFLILI